MKRYATGQHDGSDLFQIVTRRRLLGLGLGATVLGFMPCLAAAALPSVGNRTLAFYNTHTSETLKATYWANGRYDKGALKDINFILRDHRSNEVMPIDVHLLDLLTDLHRRTGSRKAFQIISGYRSPQSNALLAAENNGVAKKSLHMQGKAIDIRVADVDLQDLRGTAMAMKMGGVGYYPRSNFVHVDTGRVRTW